MLWKNHLVLLMKNRVVVIEEKKIKKLKHKNEYLYNVKWMYVIKIIKLKIKNY